MQKKRRASSAQITVTLSALAAIGIILGKFLAFNATEFMRFSFENLTIIFAGIVFGPILGAAVGTVQDLVGCLAVGYAINPLVTLGCASLGAVAGVLYRALKKLPYTVRITVVTLSAHLVGSVLIKTAGFVIFNSQPFGVTIAWRTLNYAIVGVAETLIICVLLKNKQLLGGINKIVPFSVGERFRTGAEATEYAKSISGVFSKPGLERTEALLLGVGSPEREVRIVHVTGTNGKGSTSAMLSSILKASGLKVGSFNSPYLTEMREAIRIDGESISNSELAELLSRLSEIADTMEDKPTEFELLTAAAYMKFAKEKVDVAVIECGMGARRDATNVVSAPLLSVITGIALDHTAYLGSTTTDIAKEKAGVIKLGTPLLIGQIEGEALEVIKDEAQKLLATVHTPDGYTVKSATLDGTVIDCANLSDVTIPLLGIHQPKNAALAIKAASILSEHFPAITEDTIRRGISDTVWHGRFEILSREPLLIFDGAHNLDGIKAATESIKTYFTDKVICLTGALRDKEYTEMAKEIAAVADTVITVTPDSPRALSAEDYKATLLEHVGEAHSAPSIKDGVSMALDLAKKRGLPVICLGSLYLYKDVSDKI